METHGYIRILPDSTGKRIPHSVLMEVNYVNGTIPILRGDVLTGLTSGIIGTVLEVNGTTASGELHLRLHDTAPNNPAYTIAEPLQVDGITRANAATVGYPYYLQQSNIAGGKNLTNLWEIDVKGAGNVRFPEGAPHFDAYGKMQTSTQYIVAEYLHTYGIDTDRVSLNYVGSGATSHIPATGGMLLTVGTDSGAISEVVSHQYHPCRLGHSRLIEFSVSCGDAGKDGLKRIWGYGDDEDGVFFMQYNGILYVRLKSTSTGVQTDVTIPQSEWNIDRIDGSLGEFNTSGLDIDVTKLSVFWIDLQWLGSGRVRFGVVDNGERIICHEWYNSNILTSPYMRTASLPIYFELKNQTVTGSGSEFRVWGVVVKNEGAWESTSKDFSYVVPVTPISVTTPVHVCSMRSKQVINAITNRKSSFLTELHAISVSAPVIIEVWKNATLTGATVWDGNGGDTALEFNTNATSVTTSGARRIYSSMVDQTGTQRVDLSGVFNSKDEGIRRHFNTVNHDIYTVTARRISGTGGTDFVCTLNWDDI